MLIADSWSLGTLIFAPLCAIAFVIALLCLIGGIAAARKRPYGDGVGFAIFGGALLLVTIIGTAWGFYPYSRQYHRWHQTTGTVEQISSRFIGGGKGSTQKFVVRFGNGDERSCQDTRCSLVKVGDRLTVTCKRKWQFAGQDGWDCNYIKDVQG